MMSGLPGDREGPLAAVHAEVHSASAGSHHVVDLALQPLGFRGRSLPDQGCPHAMHLFKLGQQGGCLLNIAVRGEWPHSKIEVGPRGHAGGRGLPRASMQGRPWPDLEPTPPSPEIPKMPHSQCLGRRFDSLVGGIGVVLQVQAFFLCINLQAAFLR